MPNNERLIMLRDLLTEVQAGTWAPSGPLAEIRRLIGPIDFDLSVWGEVTDEDDGGSPCGYSACAIGHALMDYRFTDEGFVSAYHYDIQAALNKLDTGQESDFELEEVSLSPYFEGLMGFDAACRYFDIDEETGRYLFLDDSYSTDATPDRVIARINKTLTS